MAQAGMSLTYEGLVQYPGYEGIDGLCHVRVYQPRPLWRRRVVIVGGLDDNPGTSITGAAPALAEALKQLPPLARVLGTRPDRRPRIVEHYPEGICGDGVPSFCFVRVKRSRRRSGSEYAATSRRSIDLMTIEQIVGCDVRVWRPGDYTAAAVAGAAGEALLEQVAERSKAASMRFRDSLQARERLRQA